MSKVELAIESGHVVEPGTPVRGGIFRGLVSFLVDYKENPSLYDSAYSVMQNNLPTPEKGSILPIVGAMFMAVSSTVQLKPREMRVKVLREQAAARGKTFLEPEDIVPLSCVLEAGISGCQGQALLGAALLEMHEKEHEPGGLVEVLMWPKWSTRPAAHWDLHYRLGDQAINIPNFEEHTTLQVKPAAKA